MENASIAVIVHFHIGVQHRGDLEFQDRVVDPGCLDGQYRFGCHIAAQAFDVEFLIALQAKRFGVLAVHEFQGQDAHAHQVGAVDALEGLGDDSFHALQQRTLGRPVAAGAGAIFLAGEHDGGHAFLLILHGRIEDGHLCPVREMPGQVAFLGRDEQVLDADICKRAARHDQVVAAARAVGVEVAGLDAALLQVLPGRAVGGDIAGGGDVVGGDRVAEQAQHARALDSFDPGGHPALNDWK